MCRRFSLRPSSELQNGPDLMKFQSETHIVPAAWLRWFVADVSRGILDQQTIAPIGCHIFCDVDTETWEVSLFVSRTEVVGGPMDGKEISSGMMLDLNAVIAAFDEMPSVHWQSESCSDDDQLGNHISFEGVARGHRVWLRLLHEAPEGIAPGRLLHAAKGVVEDLW